MFFRKFRKQSDPARFAQDTSVVEALQRRIDAIQFEPSKGFLKDQSQPKRPERAPNWRRRQFEK
jgi:hypothetical protein